MGSSAAAVITAATAMIFMRWFGVFMVSFFRLLWFSGYFTGRHRQLADSWFSFLCFSCVLIFHNLIFFSHFGLSGSSLLRSRIWPFTDVLPQFRAKVTRTSGILDLGNRGSTYANQPSHKARASREASA